MIDIGPFGLMIALAVILFGLIIWSLIRAASDLWPPADSKPLEPPYEDSW